MAELRSRVRLQPSLLDRLTDDQRGEPGMATGLRGIDEIRLRELLLRDLGWLLNTTHLAASQDLSRFPEIRRSVLNYGIPDLAGITLSSVDPKALEALLKEIVLNYEPRLLRSSLQVRVIAGQTRQGHNGLVFLIEAELWAEPIPVQVRMQTEIDLEDGSVRVEHIGEERS